MFGLGTAEIILIVVVLLLFFGKSKLPELARSIGRSFNALKSGFKEGEDAMSDIESSVKGKDKK